MVRFTRDARKGRGNSQVRVAKSTALSTYSYYSRAMSPNTKLYVTPHGICYHISDLSSLLILGLISRRYGQHCVFLITSIVFRPFARSTSLQHVADCAVSILHDEELGHLNKKISTAVVKFIHNHSSDWGSKCPHVVTVKKQKTEKQKKLFLPQCPPGLLSFEKEGIGTLKTSGFPDGATATSSSPTCSSLLLALECRLLILYLTLKSHMALFRNKKQAYRSY